MAAWTALDTNSLLPGEPFTSAIALAFEENPRAIAEGVAAAPRMRSNGFLLNLTRIGEVSATGASTQTIGSSFDIGESADWRILLLGSYSVTSISNTTVSIRFQTSPDNSTWTNIRTIVTRNTTGTSKEEYNDIVGIGLNFRYVRLRYEATTGDFDVKRANIIVVGRP